MRLCLSLLLITVIEEKYYLIELEVQFTPLKASLDKNICLKNNISMLNSPLTTCICSEISGYGKVSCIL